MTVTDLGSASTFSAVATIAINPITAAVSSAAGSNLVVVFVADLTAGSPVSVTDSKGNSYALAFNESVASKAAIYYSFITTPLTTSDTITYTSSASTGGLGLSAVNATGYSSNDAATSNGSDNGFAATFTVTGAGSAAVTNEIYFGYVLANNVPTITGVGSWTAANAISGINTAVGWQINTGTSALTCSGTLTTQEALAVIASFKPSGGGGGDTLLSQIWM